MEYFSRLLKGQNYSLFNLKKDPLEQENLAPVQKKQFLFLKEKLSGFTKNLRQGPMKEGQKIPLTSEVKEKLKSLGYIQ